MARPNQLADRYATIKAEIDARTAILKELRDEIIATGKDKIVGAKAIVEVSSYESERLDTKAVRAKFGEDKLRDCMTVSLTETLRVKPRT